SFPGTARRHSLQDRQEDGVRPHHQRQRPGGGPHLGGDCRELPAEGWQRGDPRSPAPLYGRRSDPVAGDVAPWDSVLKLGHYPPWREARIYASFSIELNCAGRTEETGVACRLARHAEEVFNCGPKKTRVCAPPGT